MPQKPERPFVPHRTPTSPRPAFVTSEFRLSPPFVPGSVREVTVSLPAADVAIVTTPEPASVWLRPIEDFLETSTAAEIVYAQETDAGPYVDELEDDPNELPPVEHFIDELPGVDQFAHENQPSLQGNGDGERAEFGAGADSLDPSASDWLETDWQHYDWRAAAALGEPANDEASSAWATTDWGGTIPKSDDLRQTAAHAIAKALDEIAKRIRDGDLAVPGRGPMTDPATIASTLAALLGVKR